MKNLPEMALKLEQRSIAAERALDSFEEWYLLLDHNEIEGEACRHHLPYGEDGAFTGILETVEARKPLSQILEPVELDAITVRDDETFLERIRQQRNLPDFIRNGLPSLY